MRLFTHDVDTSYFGMPSMALLMSTGMWVCPRAIYIGSLTIMMAVADIASCAHRLGSFCPTLHVDTLSATITPVLQCMG